MTLMTRILLPAVPLALTGLAAAQTGPQLVYSVEWQSPTKSVPATGSMIPITEADLLRPGQGVPQLGPSPPPRILVTGGQLGLSFYSVCLGTAPGVPCGIEVDSLSAGFDARFEPGVQVSEEDLWFSTDEWSVGDPPIGGHLHPSVDTEAQGADQASDVFVDEGLPPGPLPPQAGLSHNVGTIDGDGLPSATGFAYPGLGLVEPNPAMAGVPDRGDDLDALDLGFSAQGIPPLGIFFSLDGQLADPLEGVLGSDSASNESAQGADVLRTVSAGGPIVPYARGPLLGLDLMGAGTDDLDAMILAENGDGDFQPSAEPYDWLPGTTGGQRDMLLFSVRRGSAVIGMPDSIFGEPIEEGDVLTTPLPAALGGVSPFPGIFLAAETFGLATVRSGTALLHGDDVDALDATDEPCFDCNNNGTEDSVDIAVGTSPDANDNGIPDECEGPFVPYCTCPPADAPCGNDDDSAGCANSTGAGARLERSAGTASVGSDDLVLTLSQLPPFQFGIVYMGGYYGSIPFADGVRCVTSGGVGFHRYPAANGGAAGTFQLGPGIVAHSCASFPQSGCIAAGDIWYFQGWYRDPNGPCGMGFNLSSALSVAFGP